jgi:nicotinamidase-related amidase
MTDDSPLMAAGRSLLLVIDVQERLASAMHERDEFVRNTAILVEAAGALNVPVIASEQYPRGLGRTLPELKDRIGDDDIYEKVEFSCWRNEGLRVRIAHEGRDQIVIAGIESHVCVLQTALDLHRNGLGVFVVADAVSSRKAESKAIALPRLRAGGAQIVTAEMVVFEWLGSASSPSFKALSKLVR